MGTGGWLESCRAGSVKEVVPPPTHTPVTELLKPEDKSHRIQETEPGWIQRRESKVGPVSKVWAAEVRGHGDRELRRTRSSTEVWTHIPDN